MSATNKVESKKELESITEAIKANEERLPVYIYTLVQKLINTVQDKFKDKE
jgi:hypothetical protein